MAARNQFFATGSPRLGQDWRGLVTTLATTETVRRGFDQIVAEKRWINQQHIELCRVPAPTFCEQARAEHLSRVFRNLGHAPTIDDAGNVIVPVVFDKKRPFVAVSAHMDTILAPSRPEDIAVRPDGTMEGPGVTDNGTGLTALVALAQVLAQPLFGEARRNVLLVANVAEEGEGNLQGMRYLSEHSPYSDRIDRYLVVDGASIGHITAEALGSRRFELTIEGHGGHSWNDFGRANPVHAVSHAVSLMTAAKLPAEPRTTLTVGVVQGGTSVNSIPPSARAKIDIRSRDERAIQQVIHIVEDSVRQAVQRENKRSIDRLASHKLKEIGNRPAATALDHNPLADCFRAVDDYLRIPSRNDYASTDANVPLAAGVPAVALGAGGRGGDAHAPSEWYDPEGRELGLRRLLLGLAAMVAPTA